MKAVWSSFIKTTSTIIILYNDRHYYDRFSARIDFFTLLQTQIREADDAYHHYQDYSQEILKKFSAFIPYVFL